MSRALENAHIIVCRCGEVALRADGEPVITAICHCGSCKAAAEKIATLPDAPPVLDAAGGTAFALFRKDRVDCMRGETSLSEFRLDPKSPTRRVIATCCNSPMFLDFTKGHWVTIFNDRMPEDQRPAPEMRIMTGTDSLNTADNIPVYKSSPARFILRLVAAWARMGFKTPPIDYVKSRLGALSD